jgi:pentatricopeptide repeat protein
MEAAVARMAAVGLRPSAPVYNSLIRVYGQKRQWARLEAVLATMRAAGLQVNQRDAQAQGGGAGVRATLVR